MKKILFTAFCAMVALLCVSCGPKPLKGTTWAMVEFKEKAFEREDENSFKMRFTPENTLTGVAGCNSFLSSVSFGEMEGSLRIVNKALTRAMCHNDVMEQNFLNMLNTVRKYEIKGSTLSLMSGDSVVALFEAQEPEKK